MRVKELLDTKGYDVFSISRDALVYDALKIMAEKEIGALVVFDNEKMIGIISERDYARKVILRGKSSRETTVEDIMTSDVISTNLNQNVEKCLNIMTKQHFRHMPVVDGSKVVGVLSVNDVKSKI